MVIDWIRRHKQSVSLLCFVMLLSISATTTFAATLKDIRIGEFYEASKRVVFEFDYQPVVETIEIIPPGNLHIILSDVQPGFVRKIPIDNIEQVDDIQISEKSGRLTIDLLFNLSFQRYKSIWFDNPPRLVIDAFILDKKQKDPSFPKNRVDSSQINYPNSAIPLAPSNIKKTAPERLDRLSENDQNAESNSVDSGRDFRLFSDKDQSLLQESSNKDSKTPLAVIETGIASDEQVGDILSDDGPSHEKAPKGLQYYLLIGLVVLTILILVMLIAMMFPKNRWTENKKQLNIDDLLHRQEEHIASLNSQIEEQLKRYNEL